MNFTKSIEDFINYETNMMKTPDIQNLRNLNGVSSSDIWEKDSGKKTSYNKSSSNSSKHMMSEDLGNNIIAELSKNNKDLEEYEKAQKFNSKRENKQKRSRRRNKDSVGPWKLGKTLGKGSSGRVRLAKNQKTGQLAAVKIVPKAKAASKKKQDNSSSNPASFNIHGTESDVFEEGTIPYGIEREIIIMKLVSHTNIMGLYEVWENKNELYLVLEYVDGGELFDHLVSKGKFSEHQAVYYFKQIIQGVSYLHKFNISHRDLKPENILLDKKNQIIKIADFGMAALELSDKLLKTSCGSPHYASPEIVKGEEYNGSPSDVWSCGIILFALLAGHLPFNDSDIKKLLKKVQLGKYECPSYFSEDASDLIDKMLKLSPQDRISIDDILYHPLLLKYSKTTKNKSNTNINTLLKNQDVIHIKENNLFPTLPVAHNEISFSKKEDIDQSILENLQVLWHGISLEILVQRLLAEEQNEEKIFYSLLYQYQANQHNFGNNNSPLIEQKSTATFSHNDENVEPPLTPKISPTSRFSSFLSLSKLQFPTSGNLFTEKNHKRPFEEVKEINAQDSKPGLGLFISSDCSYEKNNIDSPKKSLKNKVDRSLYPLNSISRRSLNLSSYLLHDLMNTDEKPEIPTHKNDFSKICDNLLFNDPAAPTDKQKTLTTNIDTDQSKCTNNTFKKMTLDPKLKKATLKNLANFLPVDKANSNVNTSTGSNNKSFDQTVVNDNNNSELIEYNVNSNKIESENEALTGMVYDSLKETQRDGQCTNNTSQTRKEDLTLHFNDLRTTTTFHDLNILLNSATDESDAAQNKKTKTENNNSFPVSLTKAQTKRSLPMTKSFLFADLESSSSVADLDNIEKINSPYESTNTSFAKAKRKVVTSIGSSDALQNSISTQKNEANHNEERVFDYRGSLYVSNKPDFDEISLNHINLSVNKLKLGESSSLETPGLPSLPFNINNLKLSPEKPKPFGKNSLENASKERNSYTQFTDLNDDVKRDSSYRNRDSRLLEITIGDMTNENFNDEGVDVIMEDDEDEKKRVTLLFDEDDNKFFEQISGPKNVKSKGKPSEPIPEKTKTSLKKNVFESRRKSNGITSKKNSKIAGKLEAAIKTDVNNNKLNIQKTRRTKDYLNDNEAKNQHFSNKNWFIRLVSRISSSGSNGPPSKQTNQAPTSKRTKSQDRKNSSEDLEERNEKEEEKTTTILHERLFNNKNLSDMNDINLAITKQLKFFKTKYPFFNYNISCENPSIVTYNFFDSKNDDKYDVINLSLEELAVDGTITVVLSQYRSFNDRNSDKIRFFNDLSTYILKII